MKLFDLHCDTAYRCCTEGVPMDDNPFHISLKRGVKYAPWVQCFAVWTPDELRGCEAVKHFTRVADFFQQEMEKNSDMIRQCKDFSDLPAVVKEGQRLAVLTVEGGGALGGELDTLDLFDSYGVRMVTLTWNGRCELGSGALDDEDAGLSPFGRDVVRRMETLRMLPDLSHASERLFWDVCAQTDRPFVVSHSNLRTVCPHPRNLTEGQFQELVHRKGLCGLNFCVHFLHDEAPEDIGHLFAHVDRMLELGGESIIALGADFDGTDTPAYLPGVEAMESLREEMLKHNYREHIVDAIFFENACNFFTNFDKQA